jgi:hypothetical protein
MKQAFLPCARRMPLKSKEAETEANVMSAFRRYAIAAALAGLSLAACGTTPASQPGTAKSPSPP